MKKLSMQSHLFNSFLVSADICHLLTYITFTKSLDPDEDQKNVGPDLDAIHLTR